MKLATKLIVLWILSVVLVVAGFAYVRVQRELSLFDSDMDRDHRAMGQTLGVAVRDIWEAQGGVEAQRIIRQVDASRNGISVRWVSLEGRPAEDVAPWSGADLSPLSRGEVVQYTDTISSAQPPGQYMFTYVPIMVSGSVRGAVELSESLTLRSAYVRRTLYITTLSTLSLVTVSSALTVLVGIWLVGRPVARLIAKARRVGRGEFGDPLVITQHDELGDLARELNLMCAQLEEATTKVKNETAAKIQALERLRHSDRLATVGQLASAIAHELGTPLNVVAGHAKLIKRGTAQGQQLEASCDVIGEQCQRMTRIVRQVLEFSRRSEVKKTFYDSDVLVKKAISLVESFADKRGVRLVYDRTESVSLMMDPAQMQQALTNLLVNAVHATPKGRSVTTRAGLGGAGPLEHADASGHGHRRWAFISVQDEGAGMTSEVAKRLFEPFFTTKPAGEGTGLGLSITREIVEEHGGRIETDTELGRGSRFTIWLPLTESVSPARLVEDVRS